MVINQCLTSRTCFSCSSDRRLLSASVDKLPKSRPRSAAVSILRLEGARIERGRDELEENVGEECLVGVRTVVLFWSVRVKVEVEGAEEDGGASKAIVGGGATRLEHQT